jgi:hypothetical protein
MCRILGNLHVMHVLMNVMQLSANSHVMYGILSRTLTHTIDFFFVVFPPFRLHFQLELYACKGTRHGCSHTYAKLGFQVSLRIYPKV